MGVMQYYIDKLMGTHILVVDDDDFNLEVAKITLQQAGVQVTLANSGLEALKHLELRPFDCVLMDYQMPVMDGVETTQKIRSNPNFSDIRVIACTSNTSPADRERYVLAGMSTVVAKPYTAKQLFEALIGQLDVQVDRGQHHHQDAN